MFGRSSSGYGDLVERIGKTETVSQKAKGQEYIPRAMADELEGLAMAAALEEQTPPRSLTPLVKRAHQLLHRRMRVGVSDGRFFVGKFHCLDKQGNVILYDAVEYREIPGSSSAPPQAVEQRGLGLVLIPARCRTSCSVECSLDEQLSLLSLHDG